MKSQFLAKIQNVNFCRTAHMNSKMCKGSYNKNLGWKLLPPWVAI